MALNPLFALRALFLFLLLQGHALAQQAVTAPFYEAVRGKQVVYVLGTMHVGKADFYPLRPQIEGALKQSSRLYLEIQPSELPAAAQQLDQLLCAKPCLQAALSAQEWKLLGTRLGNLPEALAAFERLQPWAAAIVLALGDMIALGYTDDQGVEPYLAKLAGQDKPIVGLESSAEQMDLFTGMSPAEQKELLVQWLHMSVQDRVRVNQEMVQLWKAGDADAMYRWYENTSREFSRNPEVEASFQRKFITERNRNMVERLLAQIRNHNKPVFLAVGAIHLGGEAGVLKLLQQQGFAVQAR